MNVLLITLAVVAVGLFLAIWFAFFWHLSQRVVATWFPQNVVQCRPELHLVK